MNDLIAQDSAVADLIASLEMMREMPAEEWQEYAEERTGEVSEGHVVEYLNACVKESFHLSRERREKDIELWQAHETQMEELKDKEDWQSAIALNLPFATTMNACAVVRRGLFGRSDHMVLEPWQKNKQTSKVKAEFWSRALKFWGGTRQASDRRLKFVDAARIGFATGQSGYVKYRMTQNRQGRDELGIQCIEPWKMYPDVHNKLPREPQSGLYCVHEELVDLHEIMELGRQGVYQNTELLRSGAGRTVRDDPSEFREHLKQLDEVHRKDEEGVYRNPFRKQVWVREFYGALLDHNGDLVLPNVKMMTANDILIVPPEVTPFPTIRWPWTDFSPIPHPFNAHGYSIYEGVLAIWKMMSNLLNLYCDNENFRLNAMWEIIEDALVDPNANEFFPGGLWRKKAGFQGEALRPVNKGQSNIQDVQTIWGIGNNLWQEGSMVNHFVSGTEQKRDITATEANLKTQQSLGVLDSMIGRDTEDGYVECIKLEQEMLQTFWDIYKTPYYHPIFEDNKFYQELMLQPLTDQDRMAALSMEADIRVYGISRAFERAQMAQELIALMTIGEKPAYMPYAKPHETFRRYAELVDQPDLVLTKEELIRKDNQQLVDGMADAALAAAGLGPDPTMQGPPAPQGNGQAPQPSSPKPQQPQAPPMKPIAPNT